MFKINKLQLQQPQRQKWLDNAVKKFYDAVLLYLTTEGCSLRKISFVPFKMRLRLRLLHFSLCSLETSRNEWERGVQEKACNKPVPAFHTRAISGRYSLQYVGPSAFIVNMIWIKQPNQLYRLFYCNEF